MRLSFARMSPLIKPNPTHTSRARGITHSPRSSMYNTHRRAESFNKLGTEKSKDPVMITKVNPQAATRKYDIE
jgi:hypothetical protein